MTEIGEKVAALKDQIDEIDKPYHDKLALEEIRKKYPPDLVRAVEKPENERTAGEKLIAIQLLETGVSSRSVSADKIMSLEDAAKKKALNDQIAALNAEKPEPLPMASIVTDGDWRSVAYAVEQPAHRSGERTVHVLNGPSGPSAALVAS
jgi:hypothetical protein